MEYPYFLAAPPVGYTKIINGKLNINNDNNLFEMWKKQSA
jgi:hypothetical protein